MLKRHMQTSKKALRLQREAEKDRKERRKHLVVFSVLAVIGIVVGTAVTVYQAKLVPLSRELDQQQSPSSTNRSDLKTSSTRGK